MLPVRLASFFSPALYARLGCALVLFVAAAASFNGVQDSNTLGDDTGFNSADSATFPGIITGVAQKPYVFRRLIPDVAGWAARVTPQSVQDRLYTRVFALKDPAVGVAIISFSKAPVARDRVWFFRYLVFYVMQFFSALLAVFALHLVCRTQQLPAAVTLFAPVVVMLLAPYFIKFYYDYLELALFALAAWIALRRAWWWLFPLAALGAWNKESFLFFVPTLFPLLRQRLSRRAATGVIVGCCLVCGLIYLHERTLYAGNANSSVWVQWKDHFRVLLDPREDFYAMVETYGVRTPRPSTLLPTLFLLWSFARVWRRLPQVFRSHGVLAIAINLPLYVLFCTPGEYRNLSLLSVAFLLVVAWNLQDALERASPPSPSSA